MLCRNSKSCARAQLRAEGRARGEAGGGGRASVALLLEGLLAGQAPWSRRPVQCVREKGTQRGGPKEAATQLLIDQLLWSLVVVVPVLPLHAAGRRLAVQPCWTPNPPAAAWCSAPPAAGEDRVLGRVSPGLWATDQGLSSYKSLLISGGEKGLSRMMLLAHLCRRWLGYLPGGCWYVALILLLGLLYLISYTDSGRHLQLLLLR